MTYETSTRLEPTSREKCLQASDEVIDSNTSHSVRPRDPVVGKARGKNQVAAVPVHHGTDGKSPAVVLLLKGSGVRFWASSSRNVSEIPVWSDCSVFLRTSKTLSLVKSWKSRVGSLPTGVLLAGLNKEGGAFAGTVKGLLLLLGAGSRNGLLLDE